MKPLNLIALLLFLAALVGVLLLPDRAQIRAQGLFLKTIAPVVAKGSETERNIKSSIEDLDTRLELERRNRELEAKVEELPLILEELEALRAENTNLKTSLGFMDTDRFNLVAARVIQRETKTWWHSVLIDKGSEDGIRNDQAVRGPAGLVGKVINTSPHQSEVLLMTDEMCQVPAMIVGATREGKREIGLVQGWRGGVQDERELRMTMLPRSPEAEPGAQVYTSGEGGVFPSGIPVGRIREVRPGDLAGEATLLPEVNFVDLEYVFVIAASAEEPVAVEPAPVAQPAEESAAR